MPRSVFTGTEREVVPAEVGEIEAPNVQFAPAAIDFPEHVSFEMLTVDGAEMLWKVVAAPLLLTTVIVFTAVVCPTYRVPRSCIDDVLVPVPLTPPQPARPPPTGEKS